MDFQNGFKADSHFSLSRRSFLSSAIATTLGIQPYNFSAAESPVTSKAQIAITFDLEMSRQYPRRDMLEWDFQKGNLNQETKAYSLKAAEIASGLNGLVHYFCVGRVLEQEDIQWLKTISELGHPIGNHTYDHVNVWATDPEKTQFRFQRSPWLLGGKSADQVIRQNIRLTTEAMKQRLNISPDGFRTPGGSSTALDAREDLQNMLLAEGFSWVSSKYPSHKYSSPDTEPDNDIYQSILTAQKEAQPYIYPSGLVEIPMSPISDVGAFRTSHWKLKYFLKSVELCIQQAIEQGSVFDFLCHPSIMYVEDPHFETVKLICKLVNQSGGRAEIVGLSDIAKSVPRKTS
ncbi:polysaccharide deacetylase family protein [Gimesia sp.]|uniref:polysaccharide deacetylase family protein n=1 Tax=Gimesia sp. TaxID=2024833 RepID=UPI000C3CA764|nr:polysaccharide deacetylase family protein [Gimesia sp.]MAX37599.1 chitin deacetylase [Gimesia sp.]HAH47321.1 chitin deacetylase [Planctomycetaceae bacterium]|tara:strand:- start:49670 stop:50707 length:1038 start_codon:yes stop_codon:yes gene_type:complete